MASPASTNRLFSAKQLVFACILLTVVSVVAFVGGVVVGRDSPQRTRGAAGSAVPAAPGASQAAPRLVIVGEPDGAPTADALDEVTYPDRLGADGPYDETLRGLPLYSAGAAPSTPAPVPATVPPRSASSDPLAGASSAAVDTANPVNAAGPAPAAALEAAAPVSPPPESDPYTVQVAALRAPEAAEAFAGRLIAKGFPAYVVEPSPEGPVAMYRVRVGRYTDHGEAEQVRQRLQQEEQLMPWITR